MEHPIAYPCGCVYVYLVDSRGWRLKDKRDRGVMSKPCLIHLQEIRSLGMWGD
jgi:hypothetical protein